MAAPTNPPVLALPWSEYASQDRHYADFKPWDILFDTIAGGSVGALTVAGIRKKDILLTVIDVGAATEVCITAETTITADETITTTSTDTSGHQVLVSWIRLP
jgi:hypothetical protein